MRLSWEQKEKHLSTLGSPVLMRDQPIQVWTKEPGERQLKNIASD